MFASTVSRKGSRYTEGHATDFRWSRAFPMTYRSEVYETLLLLFARDSVPPACICDNAKEYIISEGQRCYMSLEAIKAKYSLVKYCKKSNKET